MNIDEIKRSLNKRRTNFTSPLPPPPSPSSPDRREQSDLSELHSINEVFTRAFEEEKKKPESEIWYCEEDCKLNLDDVRRTISDLGLDEEEFDWRRETNKGRKSRREFTNFLKTSL